MFPVLFLFRSLGVRMLNRQDPKAVSESLLEKTGAAYKSGDAESVVQCFLLPQEMGTFEGRRLMETPEQLRDTFEAVRLYHRRLGVTQMVRHCLVAEYKDADTIEATHESRLLSGQRLVQRPYPAFSVLKRIGGVWKIASSQYAITDAPFLSDALMGRTSRQAD